MKIERDQIPKLILLAIVFAVLVASGLYIFSTKTLFTVWVSNQTIESADNEATKTEDRAITARAKAESARNSADKDDETARTSRNASNEAQRASTTADEAAKNASNSPIRRPQSGPQK